MQRRSSLTRFCPFTTMGVKVIVQSSTTLPPALHRSQRSNSAHDGIYGHFDDIVGRDLVWAIEGAVLAPE